MATADPAVGPRERLTVALRRTLAEQEETDPAEADRLRSLLFGRASFEALMGAPPGGMLASLPAPFDGLDLSTESRQALEDLRSTITADGLEPAAIGEEYETTLPTTDRAANGQYITPDPVASALVSWALRGSTATDEPPEVLDPAVGTGAFLRTAYEQLTSRYPSYGSQELLARLVGIDVDGVALQLTGLRLSAMAGVQSPTTVGLRHCSFFDCTPADTEADDQTASLPMVDAVVGNPPFLRAEALQPDSDHFRRHLSAFGPPDQSPWKAGDDALSRRSDAYVYFVTQATRFLRSGGRLAMVLPTKWLMSAYGEDFRRFLRGYYRIHAVVGFAGRAFDDALVDTALLFAEREADSSPTHPMRFVRLESPLTRDRIVAAATGSSDPPAATRPQRSLTASGSLARFLEAPAELLSLFDGPPFVRLDELADVSRGTMTGANRFFFVDAGDVDRFGLEDRFLRPAVKSLRSIDRPTVDSKDIDRWILDVNDLVADVKRDAPTETDLEAGVKETLAGREFNGLLRYLAAAERDGLHEGRTCRSRAVWFDLGPLQAPAAFVPKLLRERVYAVRNAAGAVPSNAIDGAWPAPGVHTGALLAVLNASVGKAAIEVTGRDEAGLLQLMTYETASLPTPDVRTLSPDSAAKLGATGDAYAENPTTETLNALDRAVHDTFDLSISPDRLRAFASTLKQQRVDGGDRVTVAVD